MARGSRLALVAAAVVVAAVAFVVLRPAGGQRSASKPASTTAPANATTTAPEARPPIPTVRVRGGEPVGGIQEIEVSEGDRIRFRVTDASAGEVHLHGYDVEREVGPGRPASFNVKATITGRFEVELHPATRIAKVTVNP